MFTQEEIEQIERTVKLIKAIDNSKNDYSSIAIDINPKDNEILYHIRITDFYGTRSINESGSSINEMLSNLRKKLVEGLATQHNELKRRLTYLQEAIDLID
jgi:hypothetical protein